MHGVGAVSTRACVAEQQRTREGGGGNADSSAFPAAGGSSCTLPVCFISGAPNEMCNLGGEEGGSAVLQVLPCMGCGATAVQQCSHAPQ